jgi:hypothetical protein
MSNLTYSGGKGHYFVFNGAVTVGSIAKGESGWIGHFTGADNDDRFVGKTRDKVLALMEASVQAIVDVVNDVNSAPLEIDATMALQSLERAVEERGTNFIYRADGVAKGVAPSFHESTSCRYEWHGNASCGVGLGLHNLGVSLPALAQMDLNPNGEGTQISTVDVPGARLTGKAREVYSAFQVQQDQGRSWGHALRVAKDAMAW